MSMVARLLEHRGQIQNPDRWFIRHLLGNETTSGAAVDQDSALGSSAVLAVLKRISGDVGSLPLKLKERVGEKERRDARDHPVYRVLHDDPNPEQTPMDFREMMTGFYLSAGNGYAEIVRDGGGDVVELWPVTPHRVTVKRDQKGRLWYEVTLPAGGSEMIPSENMLHLRGFSRNGILGVDTINKMRETIGLTLALEEFSARFFSNGTAMTGFLRHPQHLTKEGHEKLQSDFRAKYSGLRNMHRTIILEEGMEWTQAGVPPEAAQMLQSRKYQNIDIARAFLVPPHLIGDLERATFSNVEQQFLEYLTLCLRHHFVRWEQAGNKRLLLPSERRNLYLKHIPAALLTATTKERYDSYQVAVNNGWMSPNDIRELEDLNPIEGGNVYLVPLNLIPLDSIGMFPSSTDQPPEPDDNEGGEAGVRETRSWFRLEERSRRSISARLRLRAVHERQLLAASGRAVGFEVKAIRKALDAELGERGLQGFQLQIEELYRRDVEPALVRELEPVLMAFAREIYREAAAEVGSDPNPPETLVTFIRKYAENLARRHVSSSQGQLRDLVLTAENEADIVAAVDGRLLEWEEKRPGKIASMETVEAEGAVAKFAYLAAGILALQWVANGEDCPLCAEMDGRIVGINSAFMGKGDKLDPGGTAPLVAQRTFTHPPLHDGCDCFIVASVG